MKKTIVRTLVLILIVLIIIGVCVFCVNNLWKDGEYSELQNYTPQQEISDEQLRKTIVSLYFKNPETDELVTEARQIDSKLLLNDPYTMLMTMLIQGPQNDTKEALIPGNTIINDTELKGDTLEIDLSEAFTNEFNGDDTRKKLTIDSITKTLTQLNEVNNVTILVNGEVINW